MLKIKYKNDRAKCKIIFLTCIVHEFLPRCRQVTKHHKVIWQSCLKPYFCTDSSPSQGKLNVVSVLCSLVPLGLCGNELFRLNNGKGIQEDKRYETDEADRCFVDFYVELNCLFAG